MTITLLLICFILIFFNFGIIEGSKLKEVLLKSILVFSTILVLITEITSIFNVLNFKFIVVGWIVVCIINIFYLYPKKEKLINFISAQKRLFTSSFYKLNKYERCLLFSIISILVIVFVQGIIYPPNNWDSMTYHLARITNWVSHQSVQHYPTHIFRQLYQPPFSEFVIMHFNILNNGDYFTNSVQLIFLIFSFFAVTSIIEKFGISGKIKLIAVALVVTIPEAILQASSSQNDIVVSFFTLTSIYFAIKSIDEIKFQNYLFLGLSIGLGLLTKGTAYIFLAPIVLIYAISVLIHLIKTKNKLYLVYSIITVLIIISINSGHFYRNYKLSNNILGIDKSESKMYSNENMTPTLLLSSIVKNAGLHIGPYPINKISNNFINRFHSLIGVNLNDNQQNFNNMKYTGSPAIPNHEDTAPNPIHFFLILTSVIIISLTIRINKKDFNRPLLYLTMAMMQAILFCLYLKWQPWHTRIHTPLFMLSLPLICYSISINNKYKKMIHLLIPVIIFYAFCMVLLNRSRPLITIYHSFSIGRITSRISIFDDRYKKYFSNRNNLYEEYYSTTEIASKSNFKNIGLIMGTDDWEYPIFCRFDSKEINPIHIMISNISKTIATKSKNIDCIISTTQNKKMIAFNGKQYFNINPNNNFIWLYK